VDGTHILASDIPVGSFELKVKALSIKRPFTGKLEFAALK